MPFFEAKKAHFLSCLLFPGWFSDTLVTLFNGEAKSEDFAGVIFSHSIIIYNLRKFSTPFVKNVIRKWTSNKAQIFIHTFTLFWSGFEEKRRLSNCADSFEDLISTFLLHRLAQEANVAPFAFTDNNSWRMDGMPPGHNCCTFEIVFTWYRNVTHSFPWSYAINPPKRTTR